jgi:hypothetical protein
MTSYLVFDMVYCNIFEGLLLTSNVDIDNDLAQFCTVFYGDIRHHFTSTKYKINSLRNWNTIDDSYKGILEFSQRKRDLCI